MPSSDQIVWTSSPSRSWSRASSAIVHGAWTRPPNGVSTTSRQSPSSSRNRSTTIRRSVGQRRRSPRARPRGTRAGSRPRGRRGRGPGAAAPPPSPGPSAPSPAPPRSRARRRPIARPSSIGRPTASPFQNGSLPGTPGAGVTVTRLGRDLRDAPGARAQDHDVAVHPGAQLVDHLLVELADAPPGGARPRPRGRRGTGRGPGSCRRWSPRRRGRPAGRRSCRSAGPR